MLQLALVWVSAIAGVSSKTLDYEAAFRKAQKENRPLLVLVGAQWCASCQIMKRETLDPMKESGKLDRVVFTFVDKDDRPELADKLMKGPTLPQIIVFTKSSGTWKRFSLTGMQSKKRMTELLGRAMGDKTQIVR